jgi:general secretion pathway protein H
MSGRSRGFTLIEILVAVVIIGIVMSVAMLSISLVSDDRGLRREGQRLISLLQVAQDDGMMQGREFGVEFTTNGYRFVEYDPATNQWAEPLLDDSLKLWQLPEDYEISLFIEDQRILLDPEPQAIEYEEDRNPNREQYAPHLLIFSSGDTSPFELHLRRRFDNAVVAIRGDPLGRLEFIPDDEIER